MADLPDGYGALLREVKERVASARLRAAVAANRELILLYWGIGRDILARQAALGWGTGVVDRLSSDLTHAFPDMKGFSPRNLRFMRNLAEAWPDEEEVKRLVSLVPWGHHVRLLQKVKDPAQRRWYLERSVEHGWSRDVLVLQIETRLHERQGRAPNNFDLTLPPRTTTPSAR